MEGGRVVRLFSRIAFFVVFLRFSFRSLSFCLSLASLLCSSVTLDKESFDDAVL